MIPIFTTNAAKISTGSSILGFCRVNLLNILASLVARVHYFVKRPFGKTTFNLQLLKYGLLSSIRLL